MNSRSFEIYKNGQLNETNITASMVIIEKMLQDIDIILQDYKLNEEQKTLLLEKKNVISNFFNKYSYLFNINRIYEKYNKFNSSEEEQQTLQNIIFQSKKVDSKFNVTLPYIEAITADPIDGEKKAQDFYKQFYTQLSECFDIEDWIHLNIVVPIWKEYLTDINSSFNQGDHFAYLLHSNSSFINLPNSPSYKNVKNSPNDYAHKTQFISSSLITDKEMETANTCTGIIIKIKDKTILASNPSDCGTCEHLEPSVTNIKVNENGEAVSIAFPDFALPVSKLGTPKEVERRAMEACVNNTGEILNAGKWIVPVYTEVVVDKDDFELDGIFFKTTGCDINLQDYIVAKQMEMFYGKKLRIINQSIYREKNRLTPYTDEEQDRFEKQLAFYFSEENYHLFDKNPVLFRNLIELYYQEVVIGTNFKDDVKEKIETTFIKMVEYLNNTIKDRNLEDSHEIKLDDIMSLEINMNDFPSTRYEPELIWGNQQIDKNEIGKNFALTVPINLKERVQKLLFEEIKQEKNGRGEI